METAINLVLVYFGIGAACFAHPCGPARPADFHWKGQFAIFKDTLAAVATWPIALWRLAQV
jgi:hypothetical protein